jgi:hypothetical protein
MRIVLAISAAVLAAAVAAAQEPKKKDDAKAVITITGCFDGSWLNVKEVDTSGSYAARYKLRGAKQLLKEISAQHRGHLLEVTGRVTDNGSTTHAGKSVEIGKKTRIYSGAMEAPSKPDGVHDPALEVQTYREVAALCR